MVDTGSRATGDTMGEAGGYEKATFAAGCFWDVEAAFRHVKGVLETVTGYTGGSAPDPGYEEVAGGATGHAEAVGLVFDPAIVTYDQLLDLFWSIHDPTQAGGQGDYTGSQYRSAIYYHSDAQKEAATRSRDRLQASERYGDRHILTEILPAGQFWPAEECHQQFYEKCGSSSATGRQFCE